MRVCGVGESCGEGGGVETVDRDGLRGGGPGAGQKGGEEQLDASAEGVVF